MPNVLHLDPAQNEQKFTQEDDCLRAGGVCVAKEGCPEEKLSKQGGCPAQASMGAVCCHSLSESETICQKLGGQCKEACPETLVIARANDCDNGLKCCPLV
ncbi:hypothetical protein RUM43_002697 [Polyplax serrata]|uniref:Uncharacterized protein n=1 Tax=Polyplax serrata TaxID=468196 RepID=A0AAN8S2S0_POLSC